MRRVGALPRWRRFRQDLGDPIAQLVESRAWIGRQRIGADWNRRLRFEGRRFVSTLVVCLTVSIRRAESHALELRAEGRHVAPR
jgi:hypothetical protein